MALEATAEAPETARPETREIPAGTGPRLHASVLGFLLLYGFVAAALYLGAGGDTRLLPGSLALLPLLLTLGILGGAFARVPAHRGFYLAASTVPLFTLLSLTLVGTLPTLTQSLVSYLLLGITLIVFQQATHTRIPPEGLEGRAFLRTLPYGLGLAAAFALVTYLIFDLPPLFPGEPATTAVLVAAAVAFLDEYWFRGVLQSQVAAVTTPFVGWLATVLLFVAVAAPQGDPMVLVSQAWIGILLGYLVWWRGLLPLALVVRTAAAILLVLFPALPLPI